MGRRSQERMTGKTYEERKRRGERTGSRLWRFVTSLRRLNKEPPRLFANVRRHGRATLNPKLIKKGDKNELHG